MLRAITFGQSIGKTLGIEPSVGIGRVELAHHGPDGLVFENSMIGKVMIRRGLVRVGEDEDGIAGSGHAADARVQHLGPSGTVFEGTVAELPVFVATDRPERTICLYHQGFDLVRWNRSRRPLRLLQRSPPSRENAGLHGAVAQLATMIPSHGPKRTVLLQEQSVTAPGSHCDHSIVDHLNGCMPVFGGAVAQLTILVSTHGPERSIRLDEQAVVAGSCCCHHLAGYDLEVVIPVRRGAVAKLAVGVVSKSPKRSVLFDK